MAVILASGLILALGMCPWENLMKLVCLQSKSCLYCCRVHVATMLMLSR